MNNHVPEDYFLELNKMQARKIRQEKQLRLLQVLYMIVIGFLLLVAGFIVGATCG